MIFYIDKTIGDFLNEHEFNPETKMFFCKLAQVHKDGKVILCGHIESIEALEKKLEVPYQNIYRIIHGNHVENRALFDAVETIFVLSLDEKPHVPEFMSGKVQLIPVATAMEMDLDSGCHLLGENLEDCRFYCLLANFYCIQKKISSITISPFSENGGGNSTADVCEKRINEDRVPTLCIVDGDIKFGSSQEYPNPPKRGETLKKVERLQQKLDAEHCQIPFHILPLPIHEAENLIPLSILSELEKTLPEITPGLAILNHLKQINNGEPILYYDFKNGFTKFEEGPKLSYWKSVLEKVYTSGSILTDGISSQCPKISSNQLLKRASALLEQPSTLSTLKLDSYLRAHWDKIGMTVFTWCCANKKIRL